LKLWWEGGGDLYIRSRRLKLEFSFSSSGSPAQVVPAPLLPMRAKEFADFLTATVTESGGGAAGKLKAALVYKDDLDYELPPGATFADEGDPDEDNIPPDLSAAQHDALAEKYHKLGKTQDATDYILYHAPKATQAVFYGRNGPAPFDLREPGEAGPGHVSSDGIHLTGDTDTTFQGFFVVGDQISASGQTRVITLIDSNQKLTVSSAFNPDLAAGTAYSRVATDRETREGYTYVPQAPATSPGGETIMDYAADIAAVLCLGATPHLLSSGDLRVPTLAGKQDPGGHAVDQSVGKIYQVFRNWSLDRRRLNEWRMLVGGHALSEKFEAADSYDSAMTQPRDPAWKTQVAAGERFALDRGWAPALREWLTMAGKNDQNAVDAAGHGAGPSAPTNQQLSQALAFLFDLPNPVVVH
jgi:hypothetical protein